MADENFAKRDFLITIAEMYYIEGLSQQEIADKANISRSNVSKLLKTCRDLNIVEIRINNTSSMGIMLQKKIKQTFKIEQVVVIPSEKGLEQTKNQVGKAAANLFQSFLKGGLHIGISWGSSLYYMVEQFIPSTQADIEVFQLIGGASSSNLYIDGLELAQTLAAKLNGRCNILNAPLIVQNKTLKKLLVQEPTISQVIEKFSSIDLALIGLGTNNSEASAMVRAGFLTKEKSKKLLSMGVVGDICGRHIDIFGNICDLDINERVIGIELSDLKKIPRVVGIASGAQKAEIILGALRGGFVNILVIDEEAAMRLLSISPPMD